MEYIKAEILERSAFWRLINSALNMGNMWRSNKKVRRGIHLGLFGTFVFAVVLIDYTIIVGTLTLDFALGLALGCMFGLVATMFILAVVVWNRDILERF